MAPGSAQQYLPLLDLCLRREVYLLSWKDICANLEASLQNDITASIDILDDPSARDVVLSPLEPFTEPKPNTKSNFETLTSAIHVTPESTSDYDIKEIKEDALWLSKTTHINEVAALRVTLLAWQGEPHNCLDPLIQKYRSSSDAQAADINDGESWVANDKKNHVANEDGSRQEKRRRKLLERYLSERFFAAQCGLLALRAGFLPAKSEDGSAATISAVKLQTLGKTSLNRLCSDKSHDAGIDKATQSLKSTLEQLEAGCKWQDFDDNFGALQICWVEASFKALVQIMQILFLLSQHSAHATSSLTVRPFFDSLSRYGFFVDLQPLSEAHAALSGILQSLTAMLCVSVLKLDSLPDVIAVDRTNFNPDDQLIGGRAYINDPRCVLFLNDVLSAGAEQPGPVTPAAFIWVFVLDLLKEASLLDADLSFQEADTRSENVYAQAWHKITNDSSEDPRLTLATKSVDNLHVFDLMLTAGTTLSEAFSRDFDRDLDQAFRNLVLDYVAAARSLIQYGPEVFSLFLYAIGGDRGYWASLDSHRKGLVDSAAERFFNDPSLSAMFLQETLMRFPLEISPFLQLLRTILFNCSNDATNLDKKLSIVQSAGCFTQQLPLKWDHFEQLESTAEDFQESRIRLTSDLPIFASRRPLPPAISAASRTSNSLLSSRFTGQDSDIVSTGTLGVVVDDQSSPNIVAWHHEFSPLRYLICCLTTWLPLAGRVDYASQRETDPDAIADAITVLASLLEVLHQSGGMISTRSEVLTREDVLDEIPREILPGKDLPNIIFEIFESQLATLHQRTIPEGALDTLTSCLRFFHAVAVHHPGRMWPLLSRSQLLRSSSRENGLDLLVAGVDMTAQRYDIVLGCLRLFDCLVDAAPVADIVNPAKKQHLTRFAAAASDDVTLSISPAKVKSMILLAFVKPLLTAFSNCNTYRFTSQQAGMKMLQLMTVSFDKILNLNYGTGEYTMSQEGLVATLTESATYLLDYQLSTSTLRHPKTPVFFMLLDTTSCSPLLHAGTSAHVLAQGKAILNLCITSLRIGSLLHFPPSVLEAQLFSAAPLIATIFVLQKSLQTCVAQLLQILVQNAARTREQPPSLLGYMGPKVAKSFLLSISTSQQRSAGLDDTAIWHMMSAVVSSRQQWFAIYLLTATIPKDRRREAKDATSQHLKHGKSIFSHALQQLSNMDTKCFERTSAILRFTTLCLDHWPLAMVHIRQSNNLQVIDALTDFIKRAKRDKNTSDEQLYKDATLAGQVAEILAMYLHSARQANDRTAVAQIAEKLAYLRNYGVEDPIYNENFHKRLPGNVERMFPGLKLDLLKHTLLDTPQYGNNYFYNTKLALHLTSSTGKSASVVQELEVANINLSAVDAQLTLVKRWSTLALELVRSLDMIEVSGRRTVLQLLSEVVTKSLDLQADQLWTRLPTAVATSLSQTRLDLVQVLLQDLVRSPDADENLSNLFVKAWRTVRVFQEDGYESFTGTHVDSYRRLLQILFLSLQPLAGHLRTTAQASSDLRMSVMRVSKSAPREKQVQSFAESNDLLEVLVQVVAKGFRSLASLAHEDQSACRPSDFVIVTAILQSILKIPNIEVLHSQIAVQFAGNNTIRYAISLFSWSHQLSISTGDPIYGELAILFLLELSTVPALAEQLAIEGLLSQLSSANLMLYFNRPSGMGPFDYPVRMHSIWYRGILPLCLNIADAVGAPVAAEVSAFLNQYPNQMKRVENTLSNRSGAPGKENGQSHLTLGLASEAHSLALISLLIERYRAAGSSTGSLVGDIASLEWDRSAVKDELEDWLSSGAGLAERLLPASEQDAKLARRGPLGKGVGVRSRLEEKVIEEFKSALECLSIDLP